MKKISYKINIMIIIILILLILSMLLYVSLKENGIIEKMLGIYIQAEEKPFKISRKVVASDEQYIYVVVTIEDEENGISKVTKPDNLELKCNNKVKVGIDYKMEVEKDYIFTATNGKGETISENIRIDYSTKGLLNEIEKIETTQYSSAIFGRKGSTKIYEEIEYNLNNIVYNGDLVLDGITKVEGATLSDNVYEFGDSTLDVGTQTDYAKNTVILKVNGNLTINSGVTVTSCKSDLGYGGPKGLIIYCTGTLENNGIISMTARGAKAEGQDIILYVNQDGTQEYIPAIGASGGDEIQIKSGTDSNGNKGNDGNSRQTGGGGTGSGKGYNKNVFIGAGGIGTSYSGGAGSGAANSDGLKGSVAKTEAGSNTGGAGSDGDVASSNTSGYGQISMGGTGNPSGEYNYYRVRPVNYVERNGTGGLLVIYANTFNNSGEITAEGVSSSTAKRSNTNGRIDTGGASGGGSINIFYKNIINKGTLNANGGQARYGEGGNAGGAGGNGSVSIGDLSTATYVEYSEI